MAQVHVRHTRKRRDVGTDQSADLTSMHAQVVLGRPDARECAAAHLSRVVLPVLVRAFPSVDPHLVRTALHDALLWYLARPAYFDPSRGRLERLIQVVARRRLVDSLRKRRRRQLREQGVIAAFLPLQKLRQAPMWGKPSEWCERGRTREMTHRLLALVRNQQERELLLHLLSGRTRAEGVAVEGTSASSVAGLSRLVKRLRERARYRRRVHGNSADAVRAAN